LNAVMQSKNRAGKGNSAAAGVRDCPIVATLDRVLLAMS